MIFSGAVLCIEAEKASSVTMYGLNMHKVTVVLLVAETKEGNYIDCAVLVTTATKQSGMFLF